jgi:hypothetical protein
MARGGGRRLWPGPAHAGRLRLVLGAQNSARRRSTAAKSSVRPDSSALRSTPQKSWAQNYILRGSQGGVHVQGKERRRQDDGAAVHEGPQLRSLTASPRPRTS